jgi:hypothetical protein
MRLAHRHPGCNEKQTAVVLSSFFLSPDYNRVKFQICHGDQITPFNVFFNGQQP